MFRVAATHPQEKIITSIRISVAILAQAITSIRIRTSIPWCRRVRSGPRAPGAGTRPGPRAGPGPRVCASSLRPGPRARAPGPAPRARETPTSSERAPGTRALRASSAPRLMAHGPRGSGPRAPGQGLVWAGSGVVLGCEDGLAVTPDHNHHPIRKHRFSSRSGFRQRDTTQTLRLFPTILPLES